MISISKLISQHLRHRELAKAHLAKADAALEQIVSLRQLTGGEFKLPGGKVAEVIDNFADGKNLCWHAAPCRRFEVKEVVRKPKGKG